MVHKILENENMRISYREGIISGEHIFENHCHARYEMIAVIEGEVGLVVGNSKYELTAGRIAVIPPLTYHSVFVASETQYKRMAVLFDAGFIPEEIKGDLLPKIENCPAAANEELIGILCGIKELFSENEYKKFMPLAASLILQLLYIHTYKEVVPSASASNPTVKRITEYIDAHIGEKILLDGIASHLFVSKSTVCHLFAKEMKISIKQYILQKKLSYAANLIECGIRATEAAERIGYENYANFYKMYVKVFGTPPKRERCVKKA